MATTLKSVQNQGPFLDVTKEKLLAYQKAKLDGAKEPRLPELPHHLSPELNNIYERYLNILGVMYDFREPDLLR